MFFIEFKKSQKSFLISELFAETAPKFKEGKAYSFEFPTTSEIKINHEKFDFSPIARTLTTVSEAYADSLLWDNNKIARDLLQNFYDGHGQTLDGVKVNVTPKTDGKYTVKNGGVTTVKNLPPGWPGGKFVTNTGI